MYCSNIVLGIPCVCDSLVLIVNLSSIDHWSLVSRSLSYRIIVYWFHKQPCCSHQHYWFFLTQRKPKFLLLRFRSIVWCSPQSDKRDLKWCTSIMLHTHVRKTKMKIFQSEYSATHTENMPTLDYGLWDCAIRYNS